LKYFIYNYLRKVLNTKHRRFLRKLFVDFTYPVFRYNLNTLAQLCGTDKYGNHSYTPLYNDHFNSIKNRKVNLLEIGIGGYDNPDYGGNSLRMWKRYFHRGKIYGVDIYDKSNFDEHRIKTFQGNQNNTGFLDQILTRIGKIDVIIDDGSHINQDVIASFQFLFPRLNPGGIYVVEDTETSYIDSYGGDSQSLNNPKTTVNFFKNLIDCVHSESIDKNILPDSLIDYNIKSMHFYDNIIFITKFG